MLISFKLLPTRFGSSKSLKVAASHLDRLRSSSLRTRLTLLVLVSLLPVLGLDFGAVYLRYREEWHGFEERTLELARAMALTVEADHRSREAALQALALSTALQKNAIEKFRNAATEFLRFQRDDSKLGVSDATGQLLFWSDNLPIGAMLPRRRNMDVVNRIFTTAKPVVSDLFINAVTQQLSYTVEVPVVRDGTVVFDMGLDPTLNGLTELIASQRFETGWIVAILDRRGVVAARWPANAPFADRFVMTSPSVPAAPTEQILNHVSLAGEPLIAAFSRSDPSGWAVVVGVPTSQVTAEVHKGLMLVVGAVAVVLMASLVLAGVVARGIHRPIASLARMTGVVDETKIGMPPFASTGLREVDEVGRLVAAATSDLRSLADRLMGRVASELAQRTQAENRLQEIQRTEAISQVTAGLAHDFNNLLQVQIAALELLLDEIGGQEQACAYADMVTDSAVKGARLIHSLLSFSGQQVLRPEAVDIPRVLGRLTVLISHTLDPRVVLTVNVRPGTPAPLADAPQLEAALLNLCLNGCDAMAEKGGRLRIEVTACHYGAILGETEMQPSVAFTVMDEGCGMDTAVLAQACEPFYTTKPVGRGSGVGLSMAQGFARQSGGDLYLFSMPGHGTRAVLCLPAAQRNEDTSDTEGESGIHDHPAAGGASNSPRGHLLLVDDDEAVRQVLAEVLSSKGFVVTQAERGEEALCLLCTGLHCQAIVTDYAMPGMTGGELIRQVRTLMPGIPAMIVTGYADFTGLGDIPVSVKVAHKPLRVDELAKSIDLLIESSVSS